MDFALLETLDLKSFEKAGCALFDQMGFTAKSSGVGAMPGIGEFIVLYNKTSKSRFALLQCMAAGTDVDVMHLVQVKSSMASLGLSSGYLLTLGTIVYGAREFAVANKINLIDRAKFVELINALPESGRKLIQEALLPSRESRPADTTVKPVRPPGAGGPPICGKCGAAMKLQVVMKGPHETGKFWQCERKGCGYISAYL